MPAFIALQCFQCSTMQVKQQKKSSNKWSCVVCNEKQSVRKVFAHSLAAKDIRCFVQNFNMSRQLSDQHFLSEETHTLDSYTKDLQPTNKKRIDWTEYIDIDEDDHRNEVGENLNEVVTTEIPNVVFKKPKLKHYSSNQQNLLEPSFPSTRKANKRQGKSKSKADQHLKTEIVEQTSSERVVESNRSRASKWGDFRAQIQDQKETFVQPPMKALTTSVYNTKHDRSTKALVSKWNSFITEEDDDNYNLPKGHAGVEDENDVVDSLLNDQRVEDDIHPDFL